MHQHVRRSIAALAATFIAVALSGCGSGGVQSSPDAVLDDFADAANDGDAEEICELMADDDEKDVIEEGTSAWDDCLNRVGPIPGNLELDTDEASTKAEDDTFKLVTWGEIEAKAIAVDDGFALGSVDWD